MAAGLLVAAAAAGRRAPCRRRRSAADAVRLVAEGGALLLHGYAAAVGDPGRRDQPEPDADLAGVVDRRCPRRSRAEVGRADDAEQDQDHGEIPEPGDDRAQRDRHVDVAARAAEMYRQRDRGDHGRRTARGR